MIARACLDCAVIIEATASRCVNCQRARWRERPGREARGYDRRWRTLSTKVRRRSPICALRLPGCTFIATATDHIVPLSQGGPSSYANSQPACGHCNNAKKALDRERNTTHA